VLETGSHKKFDKFCINVFVSIFPVYKAIYRGDIVPKLKAYTVIVMCEEYVRAIPFKAVVGLSYSTLKDFMLIEFAHSAQVQWLSPGLLPCIVYVH